MSLENGVSRRVLRLAVVDRSCRHLCERSPCVLNVEVSSSSALAPSSWATTSSFHASERKGTVEPCKRCSELPCLTPQLTLLSRFESVREGGFVMTKELCAPGVHGIRVLAYVHEALTATFCLLVLLVIVVVWLLVVGGTWVGS